MITLCLIAGGEGVLVAKCLSVAARHVDEIVMVDTTADRQNRAVAQKYGARYLAQPLTQFATVRQAALQEARHPWVLVLDPDEEISPEHLTRLRELATQSPAAAFRIPRYDYYGTDGWGLSRPCRLFRRVEGIRYVGTLYEEPLFPSRAAGEEPTTAWDVMLHHHGFLQPEAVLLGKRIRYLSLLQQATSAEHWAWVLAARSTLLADAGDWNAAMACCLEALRHATPWEEPVLRLLHARLELALGQPRRALESVTAASVSAEWSPYQRSRVENVHALVLLALGRVEEACEALARALAIGLPVAAYWVNMAVTWQRLGAYDRAREALAHAVRMNPRIGWRISGASAYQDGWVHRLDTVRGWRELL